MSVIVPLNRGAALTINCFCHGSHNQSCKRRHRQENVVFQHKNMAVSRSLRQGDGGIGHQVVQYIVDSPRRGLCHNPFWVPADNLLKIDRVVTLKAVLCPHVNTTQSRYDVVKQCFSAITIAAALAQMVGFVSEDA